MNISAIVRFVSILICAFAVVFYLRINSEEVEAKTAELKAQAEEYCRTVKSHEEKGGELSNKDRQLIAKYCN